MDDQNSNDPPEATAEELQNFGNAPGPGDPPREKYIANFDGDEIAGTTYALGEEIDSSVDAGTLAYLVQIGRITPKSAEDSDATSLGGSANDLTGTGGNGKAAGSEGADDPQLTADETAEVTKLVDGNSKADLLTLAESEGVEGVTEDNNKTEIATKIIVARRA